MSVVDGSGNMGAGVMVSSGISSARAMMHESTPEESADFMQKVKDFSAASTWRTPRP